MINVLSSMYCIQAGRRCAVVDGIPLLLWTVQSGVPKQAGQELAE